VDLASYWTHEALGFTPWLAKEENLELLASTLGLEFELLGVEVFVGPYRADIVALDTVSNAKVIIENQLETTNHDHLGKTLVYAAGLGAGIVIWIARSFTENHRLALDFLNEAAAPTLRYYGVEVQLWRIGNSAPAPLFKVVSSPNEYSESVKETSGNLTPTQQLYLEYWNEFQEYCLREGASFNPTKAQPQHWYELAIGKTNCRLTLSAFSGRSQLGVEIRLSGAGAKSMFDVLNEDRLEVEARTGPLDWRKPQLKNDCRIVKMRSGVNISDRSAWPEQFRWLKHEAELFDEVFRPRIKSLPPLAALSNPEASDELEDDSIADE